MLNSESIDNYLNEAQEAIFYKQSLDKGIKDCRKKVLQEIQKNENDFIFSSDVLDQEEKLEFICKQLKKYQSIGYITNDKDLYQKFIEQSLEKQVFYLELPISAIALATNFHFFFNDYKLMNFLTDSNKCTTNLNVLEDLQRVGADEAVAIDEDLLIYLFGSQRDKIKTMRDFIKLTYKDVLSDEEINILAEIPNYRNAILFMFDLSISNIAFTKQLNNVFFAGSKACDKNKFIKTNESFLKLLK